MVWLAKISSGNQVPFSGSQTWELTDDLVGIGAAFAKLPGRVEVGRSR